MLNQHNNEGKKETVKMNRIQKITSALLVLGMTAMVASATTTNDATGGGVTIQAGLKSPVVLEGTANFATYPSAALDPTKVIYIPSNFYVMAVAAECVTTNTGTASAFVVGDNAESNTYISAGISMVLKDAAVTNAVIGKFYTSPGYISVSPTVAVTDGSCKVRVLGVKMGD